jgi:hypothetical protein
MSDSKIYLRFGVHKDRQVMYENRTLFGGLVIPAHIFVYSINAIKAAILYINRPYFIDPMTYLLSETGIEYYVTLDKKNSTKKFKPSIAKLVGEYGLTELFQERDYKPLVVADFTADFIEKFAKSSLNLQLNLLEGESLVKKYLEMLKNVGEPEIGYANNSQKPMFVTTPYFFFDSIDSSWLDITLKIAKKTQELQSEFEVIPILLTTSSCLTTELIEKISGFTNIILWVTDFNEKAAVNSDTTRKIAQLKKIKEFISLATQKNIGTYNLFGGYFSAILTKFGLKGFSHGIFYGEYKSKSTSVGGVPPSRYYLRKLHEFFTIPETISLLSREKYKDLLDLECKPAMEIIGGKASEIFAFDKNPALAQKHFLLSREHEMQDLEEKDVSQIAKDLDDSYKKYSPLPENITNKRIDFLESWSKALEEQQS